MASSAKASSPVSPAKEKPDAHVHINDSGEKVSTVERPIKGEAFRYYLFWGLLSPITFLLDKC